MEMYEYKIVPAPNTGLQKKGLKRIEDRFAAQLEQAINALAAERWEYVRTDTLPCEERAGLTSKTTRFHTLLVFRRPLPGAATAAEAAALIPAGPPPVAGPRDAEKPAGEMLSVLREIKGPRPDPDAPAPKVPAPDAPSRG
ncbi:DUF4177 domain-containing protein [Dinoroseobacter sp. PD6]|uniref:DUF4177 domain-containing protein n=1 Tax=Dinoroseobacter sp. PD6 TaxID=3028384 RepID=UPI003FCCE81E